MKIENKIIFRIVTIALVLKCTAFADTIISNANLTGIIEDGTTNITITNSGSITSSVPAIKINSHNTKNIINDGNITSLGTGTAYGIYVHQNNNGYITNSGNINSQEVGIAVMSDNTKSIINEGNITSTRSSGIYVSNNNDGNITNDSYISSNADGITIYKDNNGNIVNNGNITSSQSGMYVLFTNEANITNNGNINSTWEGLRVDVDNNGYLINNGDITSDSTSIFVGNSNAGEILNKGIINSKLLAIQVNSNNTGTITNDGDITSDSTTIYVGNTNVGDILNKGLINSKLLAIQINSNNKGTITNDGAIITPNHYGIYVGGDNNGSIINNGNITSASYSAIFINGKNHGTIINTGNITSKQGIYINDSDSGLIKNELTGIISASIAGVADKSAYSLYIKNISLGSNMINAGTLNGNIYMQGNISNSGTISLPYNANGLNSALINNFTNTGTLQIGLFSDGTNTTHSQLSTADATFESGSIIDINVLNTSTNIALLRGETLENVVSASNSLTINGTINITDNSALLDFQYEKNGNTIDLKMVEANSNNGRNNILNTTIAGQGSQNTQAAASALDTISSSGTTTMDNVFAELNLLPTNEAVSAAVKSTTPQTASASTGAGMQIMTGMQGIVETRQNVNIGLNSGDSLMGDKNLWIKPYYSSGSQNDKDGIDGFELTTKGFGIGIDGEYGINKRIGLALFYTKANVDVNNVSQSSDLDVISTLLYGNLPSFDEKTNFLYQIGYARQKTSSTRYLFNGNTAKADYTSTTISVDLRLMRNYILSDKLILQPVIGATYRKLNNPAYTESGAGTLNLQAQSFDSSEFIGEIGTHLKYNLNQDSRILANLHVGYDFKDDTSTVTTSYQGALGTTFNTRGIDNSRTSYQIGIGYEIKNILGGEINFMYNYQAKGRDFSSNIFSSKYIIKF